MIKKFLQKIFKKISYSFYLKIHGKVTESINCDSDKRIDVKNINIEKNIKYNIYKITDGRLYTDRIHDTAVLIDNKIVREASFQLRYKDDSEIHNSKIEDNIVFTKGTPRILKNLEGKVFSLLTGGGANNNYWHWLFDVLPRLYICSKHFDLKEIDYFLLPSLLRKFQKETLDSLNIPLKKRLSSEKFRHIKANQLIITDHPVVITGNPSTDMQNMPNWIIQWLRNSFIKNNETVNKKNKVYIERKDSSNPSIRTIANEKEIKNYLLKNDFVSVNLGEISFSDQVNLFNKADCVVGLHGAGFANIVFCEPGTKIVEFRSPEAGPVIGNLAKNNNLNYQSIVIDAKPIFQYGFANQQGSIEIPISKLSEILKS